MTIGELRGSSTARFTGCLPPAPTKDLSLASLCTDPVTNHHTMRLRNTGYGAHAVTWTDRDSAQTGAFLARAGTDTFFDVLDGDSVHHIVVTSGSTTLEQTTTTRRCAGMITVRKLVTGPGAAPPGPVADPIYGDNGFSAARDLVDGARRRSVPGGYQTGSVPIGEVAGGVRYAISEPDPLGAIASVDKSPVTILDGQSEIVTVGNDFPDGARAAGAAEPPSAEPPVPPSPQPPLPPGPGQSAAGTRPRPRGVAGRRGRRRGQRDGVPAREIGRRRGVGHHPRAQQRARSPPSTRWHARSRRSIPDRPNQVAQILGVKAGPERPAARARGR